MNQNRGILIMKNSPLSIAIEYRSVTLLFLLFLLAVLFGVMRDLSPYIMELAICYTLLFIGKLVHVIYTGAPVRDFEQEKRDYDLEKNEAE
jgi:hypothetical protein